MSGIAKIGSPATNTLGLKNAFAAINKVVNIANGNVSGPLLPANATLPIARINTLADILEQCVNSAGGSASDTTDGVTNGTGCGKLFFLTKTIAAPTDTITAAMNLAQNPGTNVAKLNMLRSASPVFTPVISVNSPPSDFTIGITYTGGGLSASGVLTTSNVPVPGVAGAYQFTGITGFFSDANIGVSNAAITGIQSIGLPTNINADHTFLPPGTAADGYAFSYDNLFYPGGNSPAVCPPPGPGDPEQPYPFGGGELDIYGLLFQVQGGYSVNLWSNGVLPGGLGLSYGAGDSLKGERLSDFGEPFTGQSVNLTTSPVPEPGSLFLLGTGMAGLVGRLTWKRKSQSA